MNQKALNKSLNYINSWLDLRYQYEEIPGFTVAIAHKGKVIFKKSYGYANLETKEKLAADHIFRIASHSKTFTATAILQLAESGKLRIDDYIADYLPWLKEHEDKRFQKITIRQVLSHSAGIIRDGLNADYWQVTKPFPSDKEFKKEILDSKLVLENNIKLKYSNYGYTLLGLVIEAISNKSYKDYVTEKIVKPLRLSDTGPEYSDKIRTKVVTGYTRRDNKKRLPIVKNINTDSMSAATGFYSTAQDLCKYFSAHIVGSKKLLDDESKKEMQRIQWSIQKSQYKESYGLGIDVQYAGNRQVLGHGGGFPGQSTNTLFDPEDELVVVVLTNCIDGPATSITKGVFSVIDHFQANTTQPKPKLNLSKFEGRFMGLWGITDIVVAGNKVTALYPNTWWPFSETEDLTYIDSTTFKIGLTNSFYSEGELVKYNFDKNNKIIDINYAGSTILPADKYLKSQKAAKTIGL